ncbi:hypothetical protein [uncultured Thomasclavelia sp.]|uniref:hypothetical protein n=1 Tax=uncultured Thomasclavelia sp. TaxID=3025759 RepID=UPI0025993698|nr:hypothetical protein [uncultured Thomasclavelia sp.]
METLKGVLAYKGERGYSAYEIAVQKGYIGTEEDWLNTLGTSSQVNINETEYVTTEVNEDEFDLPTAYISGSHLDIYIEGRKLVSSKYSIDTTNRKVTLTNPLGVVGTSIEFVVTTILS